MILISGDNGTAKGGVPSPPSKPFAVEFVVLSPLTLPLRFDTDGRSPTKDLRKLPKRIRLGWGPPASPNEPA